MVVQTESVSLKEKTQQRLVDYTEMTMICYSSLTFYSTSRHPDTMIFASQADFRVTVRTATVLPFHNSALLDLINTLIRCQRQTDSRQAGYHPLSHTGSQTKEG